MKKHQIRNSIIVIIAFLVAYFGKKACAPFFTISLDEQLYKNVINYLHKDNIYLYYDVEITHNTNEFTKKVLFFSKILEILLF